MASCSAPAAQEPTLTATFSTIISQSIWMVVVLRALLPYVSGAFLSFIIRQFHPTTELQDLERRRKLDDGQMDHFFRKQEEK